VISGGRMGLVVCIGGGDEMKPYRMDRKEQVPRLLEGMELVRRLRRDDRVMFGGRFDHRENVAALPKPVQHLHEVMPAVRQMVRR